MPEGKLTFNEIITEENIKKLIEDYDEIKTPASWKRVSRNTCIRFFKKEKDEWKFHMGGILLKKCLEDNYVVLTNFRKKFKVDTKECRIFAKNKFNTDQYEAQISELDAEIKQWGGKVKENTVLDVIFPKLKYSEGCEMVDKIKKKYPKELRMTFYVPKESLQIGSYVYYVSRDLSTISNMGRVTSIQNRNGEVYSAIVVNALSTNGIGGKWKIICDKYYIFRIITNILK